jgi:molybdopterin-guanine dinucleotide biosynthesis protein A
MGADKGLLKLHANTWAQTAVDKLETLQLPVYISVNSRQFPAYASIFKNELLITDNNTLDIHGPLCGVLSVHIQFPTEDLLIIACDMPLMETELIKELLNTAQNSISDAILFSSDNEPEPLCGIYRAKGLSSILQLLREGKLSRHSMKFMIEYLESNILPVPKNKKHCFRNFNAHAELNGL